MKKRDIKDLHEKTKEELLKILKDSKLEIAKLKIDASLNKVKNTNLIRTKRKDVARILTIIKEKEGKTASS